MIGQKEAPDPTVKKTIPLRFLIVMKEAPGRASKKSFDTLNSTGRSSYALFKVNDPTSEVTKSESVILQ